MFQERVSTSDQLRALEAALGLDWNDQDWGIVNADGNRVGEFVAFFEDNVNQHWSQGTLNEYFDLVMESSCDAIRRSPTFDASCIDVFVELAAQLAPNQVAYWTSREWAVTPHLRELGL